MLFRKAQGNVCQALESALGIETVNLCDLPIRGPRPVRISIGRIVTE